MFAVRILSLPKHLSMYGIRVGLQLQRLGQQPRFSSFPLQSATSSNRKLREKDVTPTPDPGDTPATSPIVPQDPINQPPKKSYKEAIINFWKSLITDYGDVFKEAYKEGKEKPGKSVFYMFIVGTLGYLIWSNPSDIDFQDAYVESRSQIANLGTTIRNSNSEGHVLRIGKLMTKGQLRYQSLGLFSVIWMHDEVDCVGIYDATCQYVTPVPTEAPARLIDIGFANRWWILDKSMIDYDINDSEWEVELQTGAGARSIPSQQQQVT